MGDSSNNSPFDEKNRWYDKDSGCTHLVNLLKDIRQPQIRDFAANLITQFAERLNAKIQNQGGKMPTSLGVAALQEMYLSKSYKRRWYDDDPSLRKAVATLYTLPQQGLTAISFTLNDPIGMLLLYSFACHELASPPSQQDLMNIIRTGLHDGRAAAEGVLSDIVGKDLYESLTRDFPR